MRTGQGLDIRRQTEEQYVGFERALLARLEQNEIFQAPDKAKAKIL